MKKPNWHTQEKEMLNQQVDIPNFLNLFRLETRGDRFHGTHWMIAVNKKTNKVLKEPGTRKHMQFSDSDEAISKIVDLIINKGLVL